MRKLSDHPLRVAGLKWFLLSIDKNDAPMMIPQGRRYETAVFLFCVALLIWQLYIPPALGTADTSDSAKLIGRYCMGPAAPAESPFFDFVTFRYARGPGYCWNSEMPTSAHLPLAAALGLETLMASGGIFDVRVLGAVYSLCFLAALAGLLQLRRHSGRLGRQLLPAAVVLCFVNATYLPWFNSFYFDTASFVFLLMSVVAICRITVRGPSRSRDYALAAICVILFTTSKSQHSLLALAAIPCLWRPSAEASNATPLTRGTCCLIAIIAITWPWISVPLSYRTTGLYNALFYRALPHSNNREAALAEFGIGSEYLPHVGQHAFEPHSPLNDPTRALYLSRRLTLPKMVLYYARHPGVTWHALLQALTEGSLLRARMTIGRNEFRLGNYAYATGYPPGSQSHFLDVWTTVKTALFAWRPRVYLGYMLGLLGTLWFLILRKPLYRKKQGALLCASLTSMIFLALFLVLFDGVDTGRHLFLFNSLLDICACAIVAVI